MLALILVLAAIPVCLVGAIFLLSALVGRVTLRGGAAVPPGPPKRVDTGPPAFGALPSLSDPVGPLGNPAPSADLSSNADSEREIYGE